MPELDRSFFGRNIEKFSALFPQFNYLKYLMDMYSAHDEYLRHLLPEYFIKCADDYCFIRSNKVKSKLRYITHDEIFRALEFEYDKIMWSLMRRVAMKNKMYIEPGHFKKFFEVDRSNKRPRKTVKKNVKLSPVMEKQRKIKIQKIVAKYFSVKKNSYNILAQNFYNYPKNVEEYDLEVFGMTVNQMRKEFPFRFSSIKNYDTQRFLILKEFEDQVLRAITEDSEIKKRLDFSSKKKIECDGTLILDVVESCERETKEKIIKLIEDCGLFALRKKKYYNNVKKHLKFLYLLRRERYERKEKRDKRIITQSPEKMIYERLLLDYLARRNEWECMRSEYERLVSSEKDKYEKAIEFNNLLKEKVKKMKEKEKIKDEEISELKKKLAKK